MTDGARDATEYDALADREEALALMRRALELLERSDPGFGAPRLQHAIDTVVGSPLARGDDGEPGLD